MNIFDAHISGSLSVSSSAEISGNLTVLGTINATVSGTTTNALTASEAPKYTLTSSFHQFTSSYTTGSFTGSYTGDGTNLYNIPASGVTGLNLNKIISGSVSASISPNRGFEVNTDATFTGSVNITGSIYLNGNPIGTGKLDETTFNSYTSSINTYTGNTSSTIATLSTTYSVNTLSSSIATINDNQNTRLGLIETSTGSLNSFTSSASGRLTSLESASSSIISDFNSFTSSNNTVESTQNGRLTSLEGVTGSISLLNTYTGSNNTVIGTLQTSTSSLNSFTSSASGRLTSLESASSSIRGDFNSYTSSNDSTNSTQSGRLTSIESATGSLNTFTSSIDTTIKNKLNTETVISGSVQVLITGTTGYGTFSSSISTSIGSLSSSVVTTTNDLSSSIGSLSSSIATTNSGLSSSIGSLSSSVATTTSGLSSSLSSSIGSLSSSVATTTSGLSSSIGSLSSSIATTNSNQDGKLTSLETYTGSNNTVIGTLQTSTGSLNSYTSSNTTNINAIHTATSSLNTFTSSFNTAIGLSGADVTVKGNLTISGTTTTVNSTTVEIGDNIIQLNGTGATNAGLVVRDATAPNTVSGSLLWDSTNDNWVAGALGSEQRLVRETEFNNAVTRIGNVETSTGSVNSFTSSINTTIKSKLNTDTVMSGSYLGTATTANLSENASYLYYTDDRVKTKLNAEGVVSGSAQITLSATTGYGSVINQALLTTSTPTFSTVSATTFTGALSGNATTATALTSMNISQFTNNSAYLTGITSGNVTTALGYTPYNATNPNGYITGINSSAVTTALGYTPYNATNPSGYISSITSGNVTTALGYTPYNATNPNGYITGISFASVSSKPTTLSGYGITDSIKSNGTLTGNIDSDWGESFTTFDPIPTGTPPLQSPNIRTINIGANYDRRTQLAFDYNTDGAYFRRRTNSTWTTWREFIHSGNIGSQTVATAGALSSMNISQFTNNSNYLTSISSGNVTTALGYTPYNATNPNGYISSITSGNVTTALGFTPYNATNPSGYITGISFASVSSKPTTISGYGITDAITTGNIGSQSVSYASTAGTAGNITAYTINQSVGTGNSPTFVDLYARSHFMQRNANTTHGISWYSSGYTAWCQYMAAVNVASTGPTGNITSPAAGNFVTSWALRSFIENISGYGWTWEAGSSTGQPSIVAEMSSATGNFYTKGSITVGGIFTENSSIRYKTNIETIKYGLDKILQMRGVTYTRKDSGNIEAGVIAEEMYDVTPLVVLKNKDGEVDSVSYGRINAYLIEAVKELKQEINEQNLIITELKGKLEL